MGDVGAFVGSGINFVSDRIAEQEQAYQNAIDRAREDAYNEQQQKNWQTQFDYQKELNQTTMEREDNAVQRSVADHEKAGFNKLLAVGNQSSASTLQTYGGSASGQVGSHPYQDVRKTDFLALAQTLMDNKVKQAEISRSKVESLYTGQKLLTEIENTALTQTKKLRELLAKEKDEKMRDMYQSMIDEQIEKVNIMRHNLGIAKKWNLPVGSDPTPNNAYSATWRAGTKVSKTIENLTENDDTKERYEKSGGKEKWDEGIHRDEYGEVMYEVYKKKIKGKWTLVKTWKNGKTEYKEL